MIRKLLRPRRDYAKRVENIVSRIDLVIQAYTGDNANPIKEIVVVLLVSFPVVDLDMRIRPAGPQRTGRPLSAIGNRMGCSLGVSYQLAVTGLVCSVE